MSGAMKDRLALVIILLALVGVGLSTESLITHYKKTATEFCDIDTAFNCDVVNRSIYSKLFGIPVAGIGLVGYIVLAVLAKMNRANRAASALLVLLSLGAFGFSLYLTYIEARVLYTYCIVCLSSLAVITLITILGIVRHVKRPAMVARSAA
jgi:vitamin-K-epoxide reductase (warfarin-sensitive)